LNIPSTLLKKIPRQMAAGKEQDAATELKARLFHRQRPGLSESAMAERIGVTVTQVRRWERGVIELDAEARERWNREVTVGDPHFRAQTAVDFAKELFEHSEKQRQELADLNERMTQLL
jgi:transcriptional regulator with XRE-family HTH domain